jgi:BirA family biotin operon repressor/biotin-[acetyl-CoA-carboxylase] ligase
LPQSSISESQKTILALLSDGNFHSGTELADALHVSRSAIWKHLRQLKGLGLPYAAVSGKGYRLEKPLELLDHAALLARLDERALERLYALEIFDQIASTNTYLMDLAARGAVSGTACMAERQTAGKGRRGRRWVSPYGSNVYMSLLWRFQASPLAISGLSLVIGIAVIRALKSLIPLDFQLKWPNDIYYQGRKLGGILVEVTGESEGPCTAVIGLGLNICLPDQEAVTIAQAWTDLSKITGRQPGRNVLAGCLLNHVLLATAEFEIAGIGVFLDEWRQYDGLKNQPATLFIGDRAYEGVVQGIDDNGLLLLARPDGTTQAFASGEVSFRPEKP